MEPEVFPNPVPRYDLPSRRSRKLKIAVIIFGLVSVVIIFLPRILQTTPGRIIVRKVMESRLHMKVSVGKFETSWRGQTVFRDVWVTDQKGARFGAKTLRLDAGLWKLIVGNYDLGDVSPEALFVDYVIDYGDGGSTLDRLAGRAPKPDSPPVRAAQFRCNMQFDHGTVIITRHQVQEKPGYPTLVQSVKFSDVEGEIKISSMDEPIEFSISGVTRPRSADDAPGQATLSGKLALTDRLLSGKTTAGGIDLSITNLPNVFDSARVEGPIGFLAYSGLPPQAYEVLFGPSLDLLRAKIKLEGGKAIFDEFQLRGTAIGGRTPTLTARGNVDLNGVWPIIEAESVKLNVRMSADIGAGVLAMANPFMHDAIDGYGWLDASLSKLFLPTGKDPSSPAVAGTFSVSEARLGVGEDWARGSTPTTITAQWQSLTGDADAQPVCAIPSIGFATDGGQTKPDAQNMTLGGQPLMLSGIVTPANRYKMTAEVQVTLGAADGNPSPVSIRLQVPVIGTTADPRLDIEAAISALPTETAARVREMIAQHAAEQKARYREYLKKKAEEKIER